MKTTQMNRIGRTGRLNRARDKKNKAILKMIDWCEKCGSHSNLQRAHRVKRSHGKMSDEEYATFAVLCGECHRQLDEGLGKGRNERMYIEITEIIERREYYG